MSRASARSWRPFGQREASYQVRVSSEPEDPAWDAFLARTPGGHHVQTSLWAQAKALLGWRAARVVVTRGEEIVAGAQLLIRPLPLAGAIGYLPKGPLIAADDPSLPGFLMEVVHATARAERVRYLLIQPPAHADALAERLPTWGFRPSTIEGAPTATLLIDLSPDLDQILGRMKEGTRYNIRLARRKGITVREGSECDLGTFHRLLRETGQRQKFFPEAEEYFSRLWRIFHPHGYIKLFLAEYEGEAVSARLVIPFGDTVVYKRVGWSGRHGNLRPNEALYWAAIEWAKTHGYHYVDLEGIDAGAARALLDDRPLPDSLRQSATSFKLGFGGEVVLFPGSYDHVYNPLLRWAYASLYPRVAGTPMLARVRSAVRGTDHG